MAESGSLLRRTLHMTRRTNSVRLRTFGTPKGYQMGRFRTIHRATPPQVALPHKAISNWLFACSGLVFGMVVIGGLTRLTKSGLSMVDWKPAGSLPPLSLEAWQAEFDKYKQFPEYQRRRDMTLNDFKYIFFWEWGHRMLGRTIGLAFGVPLLVFGARGAFKGQLALTRRLGLLFAMGGSQGLIGWWMVKSGLSEPERHKQVRVSPYRLATHLISAFAIYALLFTTALQQRQLAGVALAAAPPALRKAAIATATIVGLTAFSGAFVAGNQAGYVYNEFPFMGGRIIPQDIVDPYLEPKWRNFFENSPLVQFDHRVLGMSSLGASTALWLFSRRYPQLSRASRMASNALLVTASAQVTLGITTLVYHVPVALASMHQAGALTLLSVSLWFVTTLAPNPMTAAGASAAALAAAGTACGAPFILQMTGDGDDLSASHWTET